MPDGTKIGVEASARGRSPGNVARPQNRRAGMVIRCKKIIIGGICTTRAEGLAASRGDEYGLAGMWPIVAA
jgi:hypothetical protein